MTALDTRAVRAYVANLTLGPEDDPLVWRLCRDLGRACDELDALRPRLDAREPTAAALICERQLD